MRRARGHENVLAMRPVDLVRDSLDDETVLCSLLRRRHTRVLGQSSVFPEELERVQVRAQGHAVEPDQVQRAARALQQRPSLRTAVGHLHVQRTIKLLHTTGQKLHT